MGAFFDPDDVAALFDEEEDAVYAYFSGRRVLGWFFEHFTQISEINTNQPAFYGPTSELSFVDYETPVTINGTAYVVREIMAQGTAATFLILSAAS